MSDAEVGLDDAGAEAQSHVTPAWIYVIVYVSLLALTAVTCAVAYVHMGIFNNVVALGVALVKALLVVLFFMHVIRSPRLVPLAAAAGFFWLLLLLAGTLADYFTRAPSALPGG